MPNTSNISADVPPDDRQAGDSTPGDDVVLQSIDIEKTYEARLPVVGRSVEVLRGADIEIRAGEIVGIVGANGSGKSTLMQILVGALDADAGRVERTGTVGWCPQETLLYDRLTVSETFDLFGAAYGMGEDDIEQARTELAERLDFEQFLDYQVRHLSGGNRQKVNLGVALMHDPDVLLLDEPYTGFDWETYLSFWDLTDELTDEGIAIAIISHFVSERERFDRIFELQDGTLTERPVTQEAGDDTPSTAPDPDQRTVTASGEEVD